MYFCRHCLSVLTFDALHSGHNGQILQGLLTILNFDQVRPKRQGKRFQIVGYSPFKYNFYSGHEMGVRSVLPLIVDVKYPLTLIEKTSTAA
jgi:hypothetical protein